jgi:multiple sugar transport system ATP-binding protein
MNLVRPATLRLPEKARGRSVLAGVRPEHVTVGLGPAGDAIPGIVWVAEPMGSETLVTMEVSGERVIGRAPADTSARSGEPGWIRYDADRVLLFDAETEVRVTP